MVKLIGRSTFQTFLCLFVFHQKGSQCSPLLLQRAPFAFDWHITPEYAFKNPFLVMLQYLLKMIVEVITLLVLLLMHCSQSNVIAYHFWQQK